jgi:polysaccharide deacetylase 2 family uncharacterized protein YibQ
MGLDRKRSAAVMQLQGRLTLAFLPYARHVQEQADAARARGHTVMMHVPMQPENEGINPGPNVLRGDLGAAELRRRIAVNLNSFTGYTGINNHMGSRFSQDRAGLDVLMPELAARGLFFLDSRTHPLSAAETAAVAAHVPAAHRDVFLDHVETPEAVARALVQTERHAKRYGSAIAIGHPKDVTIGGLESWLPHLQAKGFELVTLDELLRRRRLQVQQAVALTPDARR